MKRLRKLLCILGIHKRHITEGYGGELWRCTREGCTKRKYK